MASLKSYWEMYIYRNGPDNSTELFHDVCIGICVAGLFSMRVHETINLTRTIIYNVLAMPLTCKTNDINHNVAYPKWGTISWILNIILVENVAVHPFFSVLAWILTIRAFSSSCSHSPVLFCLKQKERERERNHIMLSISLYEKSSDAFMDSMIPLVADMPKWH